MVADNSEDKQMINFPVVPAYKPDQSLVDKVRAAIQAHKAKANMANRVKAARLVG